MPQSAMPAPITAARKRLVWVAAQAAVNPPWLHPAMPSGRGRRRRPATRSSMPARMSVHSPQPTAPATMSANARPCPWLPRRVGAEHRQAGRRPAAGPTTTSPPSARRPTGRRGRRGPSSPGERAVRPAPAWRQDQHAVDLQPGRRAPARQPLLGVPGDAAQFRAGIADPERHLASRRGRRAASRPCSSGPRSRSRRRWR